MARFVNLYIRILLVRAAPTPHVGIGAVVQSNTGIWAVDVVAGIGPGVDESAGRIQPKIDSRIQVLGGVVEAAGAEGARLAYLSS